MRKLDFFCKIVFNHLKRKIVRCGFLDLKTLKNQIISKSHEYIFSSDKKQKCQAKQPGNIHGLIKYSLQLYT